MEGVVWPPLALKEKSTSSALRSRLGWKCAYGVELDAGRRWKV